MIAEQFYKSNLIRKVENKVRFAWWGAEELGLLGSRHYLRDLEKNNPEELSRIAVALNHDMLGRLGTFIGATHMVALGLIRFT